NDHPLYHGSMFIPTNASQSIPPVLPRSKNLPSVRDYPPPWNLFPTTTFAQSSPLTTSKPQQPQQRQTQSTENINPRPPSQVPPARASQVPRARVSHSSPAL
ncbi:unnamed protein product, partial [Eruca vesicaria subsp. sativa]|nr:unnamed protein product [Eruca vesicaria subsp. sativa]